jgi:hypothetical protein
MGDKNLKLTNKQIEERDKEVLKEIKLKNPFFFSYKNVPIQAKSYAISKQKFEALQKVFSDEYSDE